MASTTPSHTPNTSSRHPARDPDTLGSLRSALVDRYEIERKLGQGAMSTVYLARDVKLDRPVAVKVLRPELASALGAERFLNEIRVTANLRHPHILPLHDSGQAGVFLYYVMPFVGGESLRQHLDRQSPLLIAEALHLAREVADGLDSAHRQGIVHRDVKPANILLDDGHAVVSDFGIACALASGNVEAMLNSGYSIGTPDYVSPEQATPGREVDGRSDVYSLGCVLFEMLTGRPPFHAPDAQALVDKHRTQAVPSVRVFRPGVPLAAARAVARALAQNPDDRFASARDFADALRTSPGSGGEASRSRRLTRGVRVAVGALVVTLVVIVSAAALTARRAMLAEAPVRLVVLPFENLGPDANAYFADGVTDEIATRLGGLTGLSVIARQTSVQYAASGKTASQIGQALDADYILEATISWQQDPDGSSRVRVRPRLVDARSASQVWAAVYDAELTQIFDVESNIVRHVVETLGLALEEKDRRDLGAKPTRDLAAWDNYLQGNDYFFRHVSEPHLQAAAELYARALESDPDFALAAARLSMVHSRMRWYYYDRGEARIVAAKRMADRAMTLDPELPEAHLAMAEYFYRGLLDYDRALDEFEIAARARPNDSYIKVDIGTVLRRMGRWEEAAEAIGRASELDARNASNALQAGITYLYTREYGEAERHFKRANAFAPDELRPHVWLARVHLSRSGDTTSARHHLRLAERSNPNALDPRMWWHWALCRILDGSSDRNYHRLADLSVDLAFRHIAAGELDALRGDSASMRAHFDSARVVLEQRVADQPTEAVSRARLAVAYAGLGRPEDATFQGEAAVRLMPVDREALLGPDWLRYLAQVYMMIGDHARALDELEKLLSLESSLTVHWLRLDPLWDPLRAHPPFQELLARPAA